MIDQFASSCPRSSSFHCPLGIRPNAANQLVALGNRLGQPLRSAFGAPHRGSCLWTLVLRALHRARRGAGSRSTGPHPNPVAKAEGVNLQNPFIQTIHPSPLATDHEATFARSDEKHQSESLWCLMCLVRARSVHVICPISRLASGVIVSMSQTLWGKVSLCNLTLEKQK